MPDTVCETIDPKPPPDLAAGGVGDGLLAEDALPAAAAGFAGSVFFVSAATLAAAPATFSAVAR